MLHACGGNARCTTCRVEFIAGEPRWMTVAEQTVLAAQGVIGARLSCQIELQPRHGRSRDQPSGGQRPAGSRPDAEPTVQPPPEWIPL